MQAFPILFPKIVSRIEALPDLASELREDRLARLAQLSAFVAERQVQAQPIALMFICTHNSRRSLLGQIWAQALAHYHGVPDLSCYSGGTEATAFHVHAIEALQQDGFRIEQVQGGTNPQYRVEFQPDQPEWLLWSKVFTDPSLPDSDFAAIMTCSEADEACPAVPGAALRVALPYDDPKHSDGSGKEAEVYQARSRQIAAELNLMFRMAAAGS